MTTAADATALDEEPAGPPETGRRRWAVLAVVSAAQFLTVLDLWVVNIALPALQHDFAPAALSDVSWILDVYAIVLATLLLPAGRAADRIGRREFFLAGLVVFGSRRWAARWPRGCPC
jgi:MFS family permease